MLSDVFRISGAFICCIFIQAVATKEMSSNLVGHVTLTRYVQLQVAHMPRMPGAFPPAADFKGNR